jgi:hypothetical protein
VFRVLALVVMLAALGCGSRTPPDTLLAEPGQSDISVRVVSHNSRDVVIYLYAGNRSFDEAEHSTSPISAPISDNSSRFAELTGRNKKSSSLAGRHRLGLAGGNSVTEFKIPWARVSGLSRVHLLAERMGDESETWSDPLQLSPGNVVVWTLELKLDHSSVAVY